MLGDDVAASLPELQAQAESLQVTPCTITREGALGTDPVTGAGVRNPAAVWSGTCQVVDAQLQPNTAGEELQVSAGGIIVKVPAAASAAGIATGDLVSAAGRRLTVRRVVAKTMMVVLRLVCDELPPTPVQDA